MQRNGFRVFRRHSQSVAPNKEHKRPRKKIIELFGKELAAARKNQKKKGPAANYKCVDCTSPVNGAKRNSSTVDNNRMRTDG